MKSVWTLAAPLVAVLLVTSSGCSAVGPDASAAGETPTGRQADSTPEGHGMGSSDLEATQDVDQSDLPSAPAALQPQPGSQTCRRPVVGVDLLLNELMRKDGSFDPTTVTLTLDDQDVTARSQILQTADFPASRATIRFTPMSDLSLGPHRIVFTFSTSAGTAAREWSFVAIEKSCP